MKEWKQRLPRPVQMLCLGILLGAAVLAGCEPFAPQDQRSAVIVITNTPTLPPPATLTPVLSTAIPTRFVPTPTHTQSVVVGQPTLAPCTETAGRVLEGSAESALMTGGSIPYRLYVPPCFFQTLRRYPYVILLHGLGTDYTQWTDDLRVQAVMDVRVNNPANPLAQMVLVMPDGGDLAGENSFEVGQSYEDVILNELIPHIEQRYCVITTAEGRAIGGISRGGFWATSIAFRHPDRFSAVGGHSPSYGDDNAPPTHNPLNLAVNITPNLPLRIYLDNGRTDELGNQIIRISNILRNNGVLHTYEIGPTGGHDNDYWITKIEDYLEFYGQTWPVSADDLPSCLE